jgi:hypothetical protein
MMKVKLESLELALRKSWSKETCYPKLQEKWSHENPSLGQCAVTALIIQDYFGGDLLYCKHRNHYWNRLPNGKEVDLTRDQFPENVIVCLDEIKSREYVLESESARDARTKERYRILKQRVRRRFNCPTP